MKYSSAGRLKFVLIIFLSIVCISAFSQDEFTKVKLGDKAPDFAFEATPGQVKHLSELKGKVVLVNFFATWCGPCRNELPHLEKEVYDKYKTNPDFQLLIFGREHDWATVDKFKADNKYTMPFYPDVERKIFSLFAGQNIPRNFVIDKTGKIVYASTGYSEEEFEKLKTELENLLK